MNTGATHVMHAAATARPPGFFRRLVYWALDLDAPGTLEAGIQRMRSTPGFLASLPREVLEFARDYAGPENLGPPLTPRERRDLERRAAEARAA